MNEHEKAVAAFHEAIARNPNDANTNFNLGYSLLQLSRGDEAIEALKRALTLQPTFPKALDLLGRIALEAGRLEEAESYLRPLYESNPESPGVRELLASWELKAGTEASTGGDAAAARSIFGRASDCFRKAPDSMRAWACFFFSKVNPVMRWGRSSFFHQKQPRNPQSALFLGQAYAQSGRLEEARAVLTEGAQIADEMGRSSTAENCRDLLRRIGP